MNKKLMETFKSLVYADMAINFVYTGDVFNNEWRNRLSEEQKQFLIKHAGDMAQVAR
jgi:hypothetical protein